MTMDAIQNDNTGVLVKSQHIGLVVTPVVFHDLWSPSDARGMTLDKC